MRCRLILTLPLAMILSATGIEAIASPRRMEKAAMSAMWSEFSPRTETWVIRKWIGEQAKLQPLLPIDTRQTLLEHSASRVGQLLHELLRHRLDDGIEKKRVTLLRLGEELARAAQVCAVPNRQRPGHLGRTVMQVVGGIQGAAALWGLYSMDFSGGAFGLALFSGCMAVVCVRLGDFFFAEAPASRDDPGRLREYRYGQASLWRWYWELVNHHTYLEEGRIQSFQDLRRLLDDALDVPVDEACASALLALPTLDSASGS